MIENKVKIGTSSKVVIKWRVLPIDYSKEGEANIIAKFANKYGISKDNIKVEPLFLNKKENSNNIFSNEIIENINNPLFQQKLFKEYINEKQIENYDFDEIIEIDKLINSSINYELYDKNKKYSIKWIKWDNFMSYGADNFIDFTNFKGLTLLCSNPSNQGGKSTFSIDLIRFLLFGKVTSRENDWTLSKIFNKHIPEATEVNVEGCISVDGEDYIIKRTVSRPSLNKRTEKSKVSQKISYYKIVNGEYLDISDYENKEESTGTQTNKAIKDIIGNERDFDLMISVNSDNLKGLISLKDTERGRMLSRWIGLLPLEEKDKIARETFNKHITPKLLLNRYNKEDVSSQNISLKEENDAITKEIKKINENIKASTEKVKNYNEIRDALLQSKKQIDESLLKIDVKTLETQLLSIEERGKQKSTEKSKNEKRFEEIKDIVFNENEYTQLIETEKTLNGNLKLLKWQIEEAKKSIVSLEKSEYCPTCKRKYENVDNSKIINEKKDDIAKKTKEIIATENELYTTIEKRKKFEEYRTLFNEKTRLELLISKNEVDIDNLRRDYKEKKRLLKDIDTNKEAISKNNEIDIKINNVNVNISTENNIIQLQQKKLNENSSLLVQNNNEIENNIKLIGILEKEEKTVRNWKIYLDLIGKNGITKIVLKNTLPLINGELARLLNGVCDFNVEVSIDEKQDVSFQLIHDGVKSNLASGSGFEQTVASLALRTVLSRISTFSKPSLVIFDEILGGVSDENYDNVKMLYDKIVQDYDFILQITHLKAIHDWHNQSILINKTNNISTISVL